MMVVAVLDELVDLRILEASSKLNDSMNLWYINHNPSDYIVYKHYVLG